MNQQGLIVKMKFGVATLLAMTPITSVFCQEEPIKLPQPLSSESFSALKAQSPFLRELNLSETYAIRALATIGETPVATLYNRITKKTHLVFPETENEHGMKLVELIDVDTGTGVTAKIAFAGEVFDVKYDATQTLVAPRSSGKSASGKDSERKGPTKEEIDRYKALSDAQKNKFREYIKYTMTKYPKMSREERGTLIRGAMTKLSDGRELNME